MSRFALSDLPSTWRLVPLGQIVNINYGKGLRTSDRIETGNVPVYGSGGVIGFHDTALHSKPSIVIGRKGTVGTVYFIDKPFWCIDTAFYLDNIHPTIDIEFLSYMLKMIDLTRFTIVVGVPGINRGDIEKQRIPLPTLPERHKIIKILRQIECLRQLRVKADDLSKLLLLSIFNQLFHTPKSNWIRCKLGDIISLEAGKNFAAKPYPAGKNKWGVLKVSAVTSGTFQPDENKELPDDIAPNLSYQVEKDDLLITRSNTKELVGASAIVRQISQDLILPDKIWRAVFDGKYKSNPHFLYGLLNTPRIRHEISRRATGTSGSMKNISQRNFLDIAIQLPSDTEQQQFAEIVKSIWRDVHTLQSDVTSQLAHLLKITQINAFVGRLTESYRNKHFAEITKIAQERDQLLSQTQQVGELEAKSSTGYRSETRSQLSLSQRAIITYIEEQSDYSTAESVLTAGQIPPNQVQRNLDLLKRLGLIKAVKVAVAPGELGSILFTCAYRALQPEDDVREADLMILREAQKE